MISNKRDLDIIGVAKYIATKCYHAGHPITKLTLQDVMRRVSDLCEAYGLRFAEEPEEWPCGIVFPSVYYYFAGFGVMPITMEYDVRLSQHECDVANLALDTTRKEMV